VCSNAARWRSRSALRRRKRRFQGERGGALAPRDRDVDPFQRAPFRSIPAAFVNALVIERNKTERRVQYSAFRIKVLTASSCVLPGTETHFTINAQSRVPETPTVSTPHDPLRSTHAMAPAVWTLRS
jgi:hypothetical protein